MSDNEFAELILAERRANAAYLADPADGDKFLAWYHASDRYSQALQARQMQRASAPADVKDAKPNLSSGQMSEESSAGAYFPNLEERLNDAGLGSAGPM